MATDFNEKVWATISKIPRGKVSTYLEIARALGNPKAVHAVGNACSANPDAPLVPCHRVVSSSGKICGYAHGTKKKIALLANEGVRVKAGKITGFEKKLFKFQLRKFYFAKNER